MLSASFIAYAPDYIKKINEFSSDISTASLDLGTKIMLPNSDSEGKDSVDLIRDSLFSIQVQQPWLLLQFGNSNAEEIGTDRVETLVSASPEDEDGKTREEVVKTEIEDVYKRQVQEAYKLDFINDMADSIGKSIQTLAGVTENGFGLSLIHI